MVDNARRNLFKTLIAGAALAPFTAAGVAAAAGCPETRAPGWAKGIERQRKADLGNGTFLNPIVAGDYPDDGCLPQHQLDT